MDLESVPGEGTAVGIRLPLPDARQAPAAADLPASVPGQVPDAGGQGRG